MVTKTKGVRTTKKSSKRPAKAAELPRPDFEKADALAEKLIRENVEWLKEMACR